MVSSFNPTVQPDITCRNTEAQMNERNVKVVCEVKSKPDLTNHFWLLDDGKTVLHSGSVQDGYWSVYNVSASNYNIFPWVSLIIYESFNFPYF